MDRRQLEYFLGIVDHGSFTAAAQALHVSQPSLSQMIKALERELGVELLQRLRTGARLTSSGEALLGPARQILRDFDAAKSATSSVSGLLSGRLDVSATTGLAAGVLPDLLGEFHRLYPFVAIRVTDPGVADVESLVRSREVEIGLSYFAPTSGELDVQFLPAVEGVLALPPGSPSKPNVRPLRDLEQIGLVTDSSGKVFLMRVLNEHGVSPRFSAETSDRGAVIPMMLAGLGAAVLGTEMGRYAESLGAVVCRLEPPPQQNVIVISRPNQLSPAAKAFHAIVSARSQPHVQARP